MFHVKHFFIGILLVILYMGKKSRGRTDEKQGEGRCMGKTKRFACPEANLLPVTKFVSRGFLIKCLGQVDLLPAPLYIAPHHTPGPSQRLPLVFSGGRFEC